MAKKLPKQIQTTSDNINRGRQVSRTDDKVRSRSIGILDIDQALFYYFRKRKQEIHRREKTFCFKPYD